jgi:hypothetical protein
MVENWSIAPAVPACAGFRKCIARAARPLGFDSLPPAWIQIADVSAASSQSCDRKSKFGLRHAIKHNELYRMTESEFLIFYDPAEH